MTVKIGQIGIGHNHGAAKMAAVRKRPDLFEIVGFAEDDEAVFAERGNLPQYAGLSRLSERELLDRCDAILVETGVPQLTAAAQRCLDAGKHIHLDKPASGTLKDYQKLLNDAEEKQRIVQLGYMYRYNPGIKKAMELAKTGKLGEITMINAEMSTYHGLDYKRWLSGFRGGIFYILGSHLVDLCVSLLGEPQSFTAFMKHTGFEGVDFADNTLAVLDYGKALAKISVSSVEMNGWGRRQLVVSGTKGCVSILPIENETCVTYAHPGVSKHPYEDEKEILPIRDIPKDCRYDEMMADFYEYIMGTKTNPYTYEHEYRVQKVLDAICACDKI